MLSEVLGVASDITCSDGINKAFVVTEQDLKHFSQIGTKWVAEGGAGEVTVRCKALLKKTREALLSDTVDTILEYTNPSKRQIYNISLQMCNRKEGRTFQLDLQSCEYPNLIQVTVGGSNSTQTEELFHSLMAELNDTVQWYWIFACRRWLLRLVTWMFWIFLVLLLSCATLSVMGTAYRNYQARKQHEEWLKKYGSVTQKSDRVTTGQIKDVPKTDKTQPEIRKDAPSGPIWQLIRSKQFLVQLGVIVGGILLERMTFWLFPKAVFEIGKGKQRHEKLKARRKWIAGVLTAIVIAGIIVPIVKNIVLKFFE